MSNGGELIRPIIGIENRTAQEVFDIMCDRFRRSSPSAVEASCEDCHGPALTWFAPNPLWNRVKGGPDATDDPGGMLCPNCFIKRAEAAGIAPTAWVLGAETPAPSAVEAAEVVPVAWQWQQCRMGKPDDWPEEWNNIERRSPVDDGTAHWHDLASRIPDEVRVRPLFASSPPASPSAPQGVDPVAALLDAYDAETKLLPLGHEMPTRGASTYNWRRSIVDELRILSAIQTSPEAGR